MSSGGQSLYATGKTERFNEVFNQKLRTRILHKIDYFIATNLIQPLLPPQD